MSKKINLNINFSQNNDDKQVFYTDYNLMADIPDNASDDLSIHSESSFKGSVKELKNTFIHFEKYIYSIIKDDLVSSATRESPIPSKDKVGDKTQEFYELIQEKIENLMKSQETEDPLSSTEDHYPTGA
jgi:hypothetical protein